MDSALAKQLEEANKRIFVKRYEDAERLLADLVESSEGRDEIMIHLRLVELAAMLKKLEPHHRRYLDAMKSDGGSLLNEVCLAFVEQQGEMVAPSESVAAFQEILKVYGPNAPSFYGIGYALETQGSYERAIYNYEQSLKINPEWYYSYFGLSQVYYQLGDEAQGDHYFYLFEQAAPYNVYGNFETHRNLSRDFLDQERFAEAEAAITALSEWWVDNKGSCPPEIQLYELFSTAAIASAQSDRAQAENMRSRARGLALQILEDKDVDQGVLYFVARVLEEFDDFQMALKYYKSIMLQESGNPALVQKIGSQFLSMGEHRLAKELFEAAITVHPDNPDIRFCLLVANLKLADVNVEEYLIGRERLRQLAESGDRVELLALLHSLLAKFDKDPDVQAQVADVYLRLGNDERAERHFKEMYRLDAHSKTASLKYASFLMQHRDPDEAKEILDRIDDKIVDVDDQTEIGWLRANYYTRKKEYRKSLEHLERILAFDPWNVSYLVQQVINLHHLEELPEELRALDGVLTELSGDESKLEWTEYDQRTQEIEDQHFYRLTVVRRKLRFLYANGGEDDLKGLVKAWVKHDARSGTSDLMKLLNTNFDSPAIYWALGVLYKELWQLETASMWFDQVLLYPGLADENKTKAYLELADCYVWQQRELSKAIEFAKVAMDLGDRKDGQALRILAHALLKSGQVRQAKLYLDQTNLEEDYEARYLQGLLHYRNGSREKANVVWKPLLTVRSENRKLHNIKQEVLRFYFDGDPYLQAN